ncbi:MAG TPA: acyltransferase, partial [Acidimicrobiales bacterium]|nr:acyltransferase [Acidimicrobiales bacterium]
MDRRRDGPGLGDLVAATPAERDRVVDFLRAASILAVVAGHWLIATVVRADDGGLRGTNALVSMPWLQGLTWLFQVMPVFFVVGGFANLRSLESHGGRDTGAFLAARADRLLRPTVVFAAIWLVAGPALVAWWAEPDLAADVARIAAQPLWFLAVYLLVVLAAPIQLRWHRRAPRGTLVGL